MKLPEIGQPVTIHRPNKDMHGWKGRLVEYPKQHEGFAYVSFLRKVDDRQKAAPSDELARKNQKDKVDRRLVPISYLKLPELI